MAKVRVDSDIQMEGWLVTDDSRRVTLTPGLSSSFEMFSY